MKSKLNIFQKITKRLDDLLFVKNTVNKESNKLVIPIGKNFSRDFVLMDLKNDGNVLITGTESEEKTNFLRKIIAILHLANSPEELKFIIIDCNRQEFINNNNTPHLLTPVISDYQTTLNAFHWVTHEIEERYKKLTQFEVQDIDKYNLKTGIQLLPHILIFINNLHETLSSKGFGRYIEESLSKICLSHHVAGVHVIAITEKCRHDEIELFSTKITFRLKNKLMSELVLNQTGAENLSTNDILYLPSHTNKAQLVHTEAITLEEKLEFIYSLSHNLVPFNH